MRAMSTLENAEADQLLHFRKECRALTGPPTTGMPVGIARVRGLLRCVAERIATSKPSGIPGYFPRPLRALPQLLSLLFDPFSKQPDPSDGVAQHQLPRMGVEVDLVHRIGVGMAAKVVPEQGQRDDQGRFPAAVVVNDVQQFLPVPAVEP